MSTWRVSGSALVVVSWEAVCSAPHPAHPLHPWPTVSDKIPVISKNPVVRETASNVEAFIVFVGMA
jgi:hypothetical protein